MSIGGVLSPAAAAARRQSALARLEPRIDLVDHKDPALAAYDTAVLVALFQ